jgi:hypothetical protein
MSELDPAVMDQFYMKDGVTAKDVTRVRIFKKKLLLESTALGLHLKKIFLSLFFKCVFNFVFHLFPRRVEFVT